MDLACSLDRWIKDGRKVFLHCVGANSRTPTVASAFLAMRDGVPGDEARRSVTRQLRSVWHNTYFEQLLQRMFPAGHSRGEDWLQQWESARLTCSS